MTVLHVQYPHAFLSNGERIDISQMENKPRKNDVVILKDNNYVVDGSSQDSDCVGGSCPIR